MKIVADLNPIDLGLKVLLYNSGARCNVAACNTTIIAESTLGFLFHTHNLGFEGAVRIDFALPLVLLDSLFFHHVGGCSVEPVMDAGALREVSGFSSVEKGRRGTLTIFLSRSVKV